jgi:hypothetical protein
MHEHPTINLTTEPGVATVILGSGMELPDDYRKHPRIQTIDGSDLPPDPADILGLLPSQTRVVLVGGLLSRPVFAAFRTAMHRRRLVYVTRDSRAELKAAIDQVFPKVNATSEMEANTPKRVLPPTDGRRGPKIKSPKGALRAFVLAHVDTSRLVVKAHGVVGATEEAKRLFPLAQAEGLKTSLGSLANTIGQVVKRKLPRKQADALQSIVPQSQLYAMGGDRAKVLQLVDDAIAAFQLIREYIQAHEKDGGRASELEAALAKEQAKSEELRKQSEALEKKVRALKEVFGNL